MPKIRNKPNLFSNGAYRKKSGILTRSLKNIIKKKKAFDRFTLSDYNFLSVAKKVNINPYDDNSTINFVYKDVNPVFSVDDSYKNNNKVLHSPNEFDTTYNVNKLVTREICSNFILENYEDLNSYLTPYTDNKNKRVDQKTTSSHVIPIDLDFAEDCRLSFNKRSDTPVQIDLLGENYNAHNGNIVFFNFEDKRWEYLLDIDNNYFSDIDEFLTAPIAFNSIETNSTVKISGAATGIPINTFGFPYEKRFQAMNRHTVSLAPYISQGFVVEGVRVRLCNSVKAESTITDGSSILNTLTFFILNQRKNLNSSSFVNLGDNNKKVEHYGLDTNSGTNKLLEKNITHTVGGGLILLPNVYTISSNQGTPTESNTVVTGSSDPNDIVYDERLSSQRELLTQISFVNYASSNSNDNFIDKESIKSNANFYNEKIGAPEDSGNFTDLNLNRSIIESYANINTPVYNKRLSSLSPFNIYPSSKFETRSGCIYKSERSLSTVFEPPRTSTSTNDHNSVEVSFSTDKQKDNPYVVYPTDSLIFGFSFDANKNIDPSTSSKLGKDVSILHDKVSVELVGRYIRDNNFFVDKSENYHLKGSKKIRGNTKNIVDDFGMNNMYLNTGAYYDRNIYRTVNNVLVDIPNVLSGAVTYYINPENKLGSGSFSRYRKVEDINEQHIDNDLSLSNPKKIKYNSFYFDLLRFGQPRDKLYYYTNSAYRKNKFFVSKRFMTNFLTPISSTIAFNDNQYSAFNGSSPFVDRDRIE